MNTGDSRLKSKIRVVGDVWTDKFCPYGIIGDRPLSWPLPKRKEGKGKRKERGKEREKGEKKRRKKEKMMRKLESVNFLSYVILVLNKDLF